MDSQFSCFSFSGVLLLLAAFSYALRAYALAKMRKIEGSSKPVGLQPTELAYLLRPGDSSHCLMVLVIDFLQRALKSPQSMKDELAKVQFEKEIWNSVESYIKDWSKQKTDELLPELRTKNPMKIVRGFWRLKQWLGSALKSALTDLIRDPLSIRRYFSPSGILRTFVSLAASNVKEQLRTSLRSNLLVRELLLSDQRRAKFSRIFLGLAFLHFFVLAVLVAAFFSLSNWQSVIILTLITALDGALIRLVAELPVFLPFYEELSSLLETVSRKSKRIAVLRSLFRFLMLAFWSIAILLFMLCLALQSFAFSYFGAAPNCSWYLALFAFVALSINFVLIADLFFLFFSVQNNDQLSSIAKLELDEYRKKLRHLSPAEVFAKTLISTDYDQELSEIVAIYGIETLFLLA
ncbi:MAG: hypothetical protein K2X27_22365 [Candidatus Obscuribacterales bacterium]|nr:hypothetical protein [Candidatus Obscuribacterales bacterium]